MAATNSGFSYFNSLSLRSSCRDRFCPAACPAASRWRCTALSGGHSLPGLDSGLVCGPWRSGRRVPACLGWGWHSLWPRFWHGGFLGWGAVLGSIPPASLFPLPKVFYPARGPPRSASGGILDPVAAVIIGLPTLGSIPELAPQALCSIVQPTADKLFRRGFDFLF